jgi:dihydrofolate reductase
MKLSIIAAVANNRVIGSNNALPWHLPADLRYFKQKTVGHFLIMGRKTFESFEGLLPDRTIVVITRRSDYSCEGVHVTHSLPDAIRMVENEDEVFIAGGAEIYAEALSLADQMYLTWIDHNFEGDTYFPVFDENEWTVVDRKDCEADHENPYAYSFVTYQRLATRPSAEV